MIKNDIKRKIDVLRDVKKEIDIIIKNNMENLDIDELERFEFIHKIEKMDVILNSIERDLDLDDQGKINREFYENKDTKQDISIYDSGVDDEENKFIYEEDNEDEENNFNLQRTTIIENEFIEDPNYLEDVESNQKDKKIENFETTLNDTNKKLEYLEKLLEEKRFIEEKDLELYMKEIHLKEEREAMLRKRQIVAQSFTPKSREQSDSTIEKTIAMSKEEFYDKIDGSKTEILDIPIDVKPQEAKTQNIDESEYCFSEDYDIYEEEKNNSILDKFKDLLGK